MQVEESEDLDNLKKNYVILNKKDIRPRENTWKKPFRHPENPRISVKNDILIQFFYLH